MRLMGSGHAYHPQAIVRDGKWIATNLSNTLWAQGLDIEYDKTQPNKVVGYRWNENAIKEGDVNIPLKQDPREVSGYSKEHNQHQTEYSKKSVEEALDKTIKAGNFYFY